MDQHSKIYVAGHLGLVGSAIWRNLQEKGYTRLIGKSLEELDLSNEEDTLRFFEEEQPEYVFLAAAMVGGIVANNTYRADFIFNNLQIQNNVIQASHRFGVKKLLFLGSTCIYPRDCPQPMKEEYLLTAPLEYTNEPYAIAKIAGIKLCESFNLQYGTNFLSVMPTNLYGLHDNFNLETSHVLPALLRKIHLGKCLEENDWATLREDLNRRPIEHVSGQSSDEDILHTLQRHGVGPLGSGDGQAGAYQVEIWGSGRPLREFLWVDDMADACVFVMENVNFKDLAGDKKEVRNTHINIGTGKEIAIKDLAEMIKGIVGFRGKLVFNTQKPDGTPRKLTDPSKIHGLGWRHRVTLEEGVGRLYAWYVRGEL